MSNSDSEITLLASVNAKLAISKQLMQKASQELEGPGLSLARRAELQKILEDTRQLMERFQRQKDGLKNP